MRYTKKELEDKVAYYKKKTAEYQQMIDSLDNNVLDMEDFEKPFIKYNLSELSELLRISDSAYEFSQLEENKSKNIYDYNAQATDDSAVVLAK